MNGSATLQVGQCKSNPSIAAVGRAQNGKQCLILVDGQKLPVAERPTLRRKIPADDLNLA
jgi:hypothetical protein